MHAEGETLEQVPLERLPIDLAILAEIRRLSQTNPVHARLRELDSWPPSAHA